MLQRKNNCLLILFSFFILLSANFVFAKTDLSIAETDITFSQDAPLDGNVVRVYARVFDTGDTDVFGYVMFYDNGKEISDPQPISIRAGTYDDVFIDWTAKIGTHDIKASLLSLNPKDDDLTNNSTEKKNIFVDLDTDKDGIGDSKDTDIDGDGLTNDEEKKIGTNPLIADTDGDGVNDKIDVFPLDKTEWRDTDKDGIGDNKDPDADGDGLTNIDEVQKYGTNPLNADTDGDGIPDGQEVKNDTNPLKADIAPTPTPGFNNSQWQASLFGSLSDLLKNGDQRLYWGLGILSLIFIYFLFRKKKGR